MVSASETWPARAQHVHDSSLPQYSCSSRARSVHGIILGDEERVSREGETPANNGTCVIYLLYRQVWCGCRASVI